MFGPIATAIAPVFLVIGLGAALTRSAFLTPGALQELNRLAYWIGLPALLFAKTATIGAGIGTTGHLVAVCGLASIAGIALAYGWARLSGLAPAAHGTFVQAAFRGNLAFVGLPVTLYALAGLPDAPRLEAMTLLALGPLVVLYNVAAVLVLLAGRGDPQGRGAVTGMLRGLLRNPILIACVAGVLWSAADWPLPGALRNTLEAIGQMALPLALLCIGGALATTRLRGSLGPAVAATAVKVALIPALAWLLAMLSGLDADATRIGLLMLASPTAAASYVLVRQLGGDAALASATVAISTLASAPALALILHLA